MWRVGRGWGEGEEGTEERVASTEIASHMDRASQAASLEAMLNNATTASSGVDPGALRTLRARIAELQRAPQAIPTAPESYAAETRTLVGIIVAPIVLHCHMSPMSHCATRRGWGWEGCGGGRGGSFLKHGWFGWLLRARTVPSPSYRYGRCCGEQLFPFTVGGVNARLASGA